MKRKLGDITGLDAQIFESLGTGINSLINEFSLDLVSRCCRPPDEVVQKLGDRFHDRFWKVDVSAFLENFLICQSGDLREGIVFGSVKLICLWSRVIIFSHMCYSFSHVYDLDLRLRGIFYPGFRIADVHRPHSLSHMVCRKQITDTCELVKKMVFKPK